MPNFLATVELYNEQPEDYEKLRMQMKEIGYSDIYCLGFCETILPRGTFVSVRLTQNMQRKANFVELEEETRSISRAIRTDHPENQTPRVVVTSFDRLCTQSLPKVKGP